MNWELSEMNTGEVIFNSENYLVKKLNGTRSDICIVTFESFVDAPVINRTGFAEKFLLSEGYSAIHVLQHSNRWYQTNDTLSMLEHVRASATGYKKVISYGSSMGGYAALRFSVFISAGNAIAISPQFSIDPKVVPFENRWISTSNSLNFEVEKNKALNYLIEDPVIFYDPYNLDQRHVKLYREKISIKELKLYFSGHPSGQFLASMGLLQTVFEDCLENRFDPQRIRYLIRQRRSKSAEYFRCLAKSSKNGKRAIQLLQRAHMLDPSSYANLLAEAEVNLRVLNDLEAAEKSLLQMLEISKSNIVTYILLSEIEERRRNITSAISYMEEALSIDQQSKHSKERILLLRNKLFL